MNDTSELTKLIKQWRLSDDDGPLTADGITDLVDDIERVVDKQTAIWLHNLADAVDQ